VKRLFSLPCPTCAIHWVDQAVAQSGVCLTDGERRQIIAGLLSRPHLLLCGPSGTGKRRLADALAQSIAGKQGDRVRILQGHPWWATATGDVSAFVTAQMNYNTWRLVDFVSAAIDAAGQRDVNQRAQPHGSFVLCVVAMSPAEVDFYFRGIADLWQTLLNKRMLAQSVRIFGTTDGETSPPLSSEIAPTVTIVHMGGAYGGSTQAAQPTRNSRAKNGP